MEITRVLLDTSAYSAFMRGHPELTTALQQAEEIYLTPIILGELRSGFLMGGRREKNEKELEAFLSSPRVSVVDVDAETAERYAVILMALRTVGKPIPTNDLWIAASAMRHGLCIFTADAHYLKVNQVLVRFFNKL